MVFHTRCKDAERREETRKPFEMDHLQCSHQFGFTFTTFWLDLECCSMLGHATGRTGLWNQSVDNLQQTGVYWREGNTDTQSIDLCWLIWLLTAAPLRHLIVFYVHDSLFVVQWTYKMHLVNCYSSEMVWDIVQKSRTNKTTWHSLYIHICSSIIYKIIMLELFKTWARTVLKSTTAACC